MSTYLQIAKYDARVGKHKCLLTAHRFIITNVSYLSYLKNLFRNPWKPAP